MSAARLADARAGARPAAGSLPGSHRGRIALAADAEDVAWDKTLERIAAGGRHDRDRPDPRVRHRVEHVEPGDRVRRRRGTRADPHQPARRDAGPRGRDRRVPEPRGSRAARGLPRPGARFRHLSLRPGEAALHQADGAAALPGRREDRHRHPRGRQRRRRAAVDPDGHAGAARSRGARLRRRQVQRLQHVLHPGGVRHFGRLVGLAGHRHPRPRRRAQRRRQHGCAVELLPAAGSRQARARPDSRGRAGRARHDRRPCSSTRRTTSSCGSGCARRRRPRRARTRRS